MNPRLSVVVPVLNESKNLPALMDGLSRALHGLPAEFLFIDDGSTDDGASLIEQRRVQDPRVHLVSLARRFGQTAALSAGLEKARGDVIVTLDADGQNDPADIPALLALLDQGADVVCGWRRTRHDPWLSRRLPSGIANRIISWVTGVALHDYGCTLKAFRRSAVEGLRLYGEMHRLIPVWCAWRGAVIREIEVRHHPRVHGRSHYGIGRTFKVLLDLLTAKFFFSFLTSPSHPLGGLGLVFLFLGFLSGLFPILDKFVFNHWPLYRIPFMILSVFLGLLGMQFLALGVLAEILVRIYYENRGEKPYRVKRVVPDDAAPR
ncbi:MAG TPA: glycosyltransferase family 2 protein [Elusimicrobiota bacterium]|nr:glycosyltransferase family 2 protein [Elusimicrobiota bacterium]